MSIIGLREGGEVREMYWCGKVETEIEVLCTEEISETSISFENISLACLMGGGLNTVLDS